VKRVLLCLTLAVLPSLGGSRQAPVAPVAIYSLFEQLPSADIREAVQSELEAIMQPIGLHFEWRTLGAVENSATELVVVNFKGHCDVDRLLPFEVLPGALGWTHVSDGVVLPFSAVDCDAVRGFLQRDLLAQSPLTRGVTYGRALGRVLAHELYHVLAGTSDHGACGIAKAGYTVTDLLAREFVFEAAELHKLAASKAYQILEWAAAVPASTR
jgi:hypothetical protein